jgi:predicted SprT family Zn-dependent metalloprotease
MKKKAAKQINYLKREQVVLTPELKAEVEVEVKKAVDFANKVYKSDLAYPDIKWDLRSRVGGMAIYAFNRLRFHPVFAAENPKDYKKQTVWHEVAHLVARHVYKTPKNPKAKKVMSHGEEWREVMVKFGRGPKPGESWDTVIKHIYNPASLALPERKKLGPRKPGGRKVGEIIARMKTLTPEEMDALKERLGMEINIAEPQPPSPLEIKAQAESGRLRELLLDHFTHIQPPRGTVSTAGWAMAVIENLRNAE